MFLQKWFLLYLSLVFIVFSQASAKESLTPPRCWNDIDFEKTEKILGSASIKKQIPFYEYYKNTTSKRYFDNKFYSKRKEDHYNERPIFVLFYSNGLKAVSKGEEYKTGNKGLDNAITAYNFQKFLNLKMVPPSVIRTIKGKKMLVQLFVENIIDKKYKDKYIKQLSPDKKVHLYLLVFLLGNRGFHSNNVLISEKCFLPVLIDNDYLGSIVFKEYGELPFLRYPSLKVYRNNRLKRSDFDVLPLEKVITLKKPSLELLKKSFFVLGFDYIKSIKNDFLLKSGDIVYFKYKKSYYFQRDDLHSVFKPISKNIQDYSSEAIKKLKLINGNQFKKIAYGSLKKNKAFLIGFLYRKDQFFKAIQEEQKEK